METSWNFHQNDASRRRNSEVHVRPVSQVLLRVTDAESDDLHRSVQKEVLKWLNEHSSVPLPEAGWQGHSFELDGIKVQRTAAIALKNKHRYWAAFQDDDDRNIARRTWTTEVGLAQKDAQTVLLGSRLVCASRGDNPPIDSSIPRFIRNVVRKYSVSFDGGVPIISRPLVVKTEADVESLISLLLSRSRKAPVVIFSLAEDEENPIRTSASPQEVHVKTLGAAHIRILTGPASYLLSKYIGKEFSVYNQAIRTYYPNFLLNDDQPSRHPVAFGDTVYEWKERWGVTFETFVSNQILAGTVSGPGYEDRLPSFIKVKRALAENQRRLAQEQKADDKTLLTYAMDEIAVLEAELKEKEEEYGGLLELAEEEKQQALEEAREARSQNIDLRYRVEHLRTKLNEQPAANRLQIPETLDEFEQWCKLHLSGQVVLHNRAYRGLKKSNYQDVSLIYKSLLLLRDYYVPMKRGVGNGEAKQYFMDKCKEMGIEESRSMTSERLDKADDEYFVHYEGKKRKLDRHLKKGRSRDGRRCFRLYFFWDGDNEQVVVGWLPSHLTTRRS